MTTKNNSTLCGLIVAAGKSTRMGESKQLLNYRGVSFLSIIIKKLQLVCDYVIVVLGHEGKEIQGKIISEQARLDQRAAPKKNTPKFVVNEDYESGMFTSLQKGLKEVAKKSWVLYHFADQPTIPEDFYNRFAQQISEKVDWIQPLYEGRKGHPILLSPSLQKEILVFDPGSTLKHFFNTIKPAEMHWPCEFQQILQDIDTPSEYEKIRNE